VRTRVLLGLGAIVVVALLLNLWAMMRPSAADAPAAPIHATQRAPEVAPVASSDLPSRPIIPVMPRVPVPTSQSHDPPPVLEGSRPTVPKDPAVERADSIRRWMNAEIINSEQAVIDCLGKDNAKLEGYAAIPFKITKKAGKVVVEAQAADANTFADPKIVECMRGATAAMKYESLPPGVDTVTTYRKIVVKDGQLVENWLGPHETTDSKH
jgi:hypothetical protein